MQGTTSAPCAEMPVAAEAPLGLAIVHLIGQEEKQAATTARELVARTKTEVKDVALRGELIELIETIIIYKLPRLGREEIQAMLQVHDIRETRVYQEGREEGIQEGLEKGIEKGNREGDREGDREGQPSREAQADPETGGAEDSCCGDCRHAGT